MAEGGHDIFEWDFEMDRLDPEDFAEDAAYDEGTQSWRVPEAPDSTWQGYEDILVTRIQAGKENELPGVINIYATEPTAYEKGVIIGHYQKYLQTRGAAGRLADVNQFELVIEDYNAGGREGKVFTLFYDNVPLSNNGKFYAESTLYKKANELGKSGVQFFKNMGITNFASGNKKFVKQETVNAAQQATRAVEEALSMPSGRTNPFDRTTEAVDTLGAEIENDPLINNFEMSDFVDERNRLKSMTGVLDSLIEKRNNKAKELERLKNPIDGDEDIMEEGRVSELEKEIDEFDQAIADQDNKVRNQLQTIKDSLTKFFGETESTLGEKVRTLFREQGVTIVSVLTAIGMAISTLATSIALGVKNATPNPKPKPPGPKPPGPDPGPDPGPSPTPKPTPGSKEWIKQMLQKIANLLIKLGDKALAALPGIIGAVVNFLLKSAASAVGFLAENLWALIVAIGGLLLAYVYPSPKPKSKRK